MWELEMNLGVKLSGKCMGAGGHSGILATYQRLKRSLFWDETRCVQMGQALRSLSNQQR